MPSSRDASFALRRIAAVLAAGLLGACAMSPERQAYRERLESGFVTPQDIERFRTPEREQLALAAQARDFLPRDAQPPDKQLMQAAAAGDSARIKALLAQGAQVNAADARGNGALLLATREGEVESVRLLLDAGAHVEGRGGVMPPLAAAALRGHLTTVRLLLRNRADVNAVGENGLSALMNAVKLNHLGVAQALLEAGADKRVLDRAGDNLLVVAISQNQPAMLALLLAQGVAPDLADANGLTALYWAEHLQRTELGRLLRQAGADPARKKSGIVIRRPYDLREY